MSEQQKIQDLESRVMELEKDRDNTADYESLFHEEEHFKRRLKNEVAENEELIKKKDKIIRDMRAMATEALRLPRLGAR